MMGFPERLESEFLFDIEATLDEPPAVGATPIGGRTIFPVTGGRFEGPRLRGEVAPGGADWFVTRINGAGELDVRITLRTDDGALVYAAYGGVLDAKPEVMARVFAGEDVDPVEYYFRTTPRFETGAEEYAWLNNVVCVGVGKAAPGKVSYRVFAIR
jgi:hypothetical protein